MNVIKISLIYLTLGLGAFGTDAFGRPVGRCQYLLTDEKETLANLELARIDHLRTRESLVLRYTLGALLAAYEADRDVEPLTVNEAYSFVPADRSTAKTYLRLAAAQGFIRLERQPGDARRRLVHAGPKLGGLVNAELTTTLWDVIAGARALNTEVGEAIDFTSTARSAALDRMLISKLWRDYDRAYLPSAAPDQLHLRNTYALLVHVYALDLRGEKVIKTHAVARMPIKNIQYRNLAIDRAVAQGLIRIQNYWKGQRGLYLDITPKLIAMMEQRLNSNIARMNAIVGKVANEADSLLLIRN